MTVGIFFSLYLSTMAILMPVDEVWNYNNPRPFPMKEYIVVNWERGDFKKIDGQWVLLKKHMYDPPIKAKARKKYWDSILN